MMPMGYWTVISKEPFRFLICMQMGDYSLVLRTRSEREKVVKAGNIPGRQESKSDCQFLNGLAPATSIRYNTSVRAGVAKW